MTNEDCSVLLTDRKQGEQISLHMKNECITVRTGLEIVFSYTSNEAPTQITSKQWNSKPALVSHGRVSILFIPGSMWRYMKQCGLI